jgi:hypothetical protein
MTKQEFIDQVALSLLCSYHSVDAAYIRATQFAAERVLRYGPFESEEAESRQALLGQAVMEERNNIIVRLQSKVALLEKQLTRPLAEVAKAEELLRKKRRAKKGGKK